MHDLAAFVLHLHLFLRVAGRQERINVRQHVESDLVRINLSRHRLLLDDLVHLALQFGDGLGARARYGLVAGGEDAFAGEGRVQRIERHQRDGGGAVRIGNDALVPFHVRGVNLGDD